MSAVIVPFALASLISGIVQAVGTKWGLFRHYWVISKLALTAVATAVLLIHTTAVQHATEAAATGAFGTLEPLRTQLLADAIAGLCVLLVIAVLGWVKPRGQIRLG